MADDDQAPADDTGSCTPETSPPEGSLSVEPAASLGSAPPSSAPPPAAPASPEPAPLVAAAYRPSYVFLVVVTVINLAADLWSKHWAKSYFESIRPGDSRRVVVYEDVISTGMNFIFAKNRGGAWGLLQNETESLRRPFFLVVSVAAIVFIVSLYRKLTPGQRALKWGLPLVLGGALGNLVDRIRYGYVVDFIDVYVTVNGQVKHWPTFNVADIAICVGVALMAVDMFTTRDKRKTPAAAVEPAPASAPDPSPPPEPRSEPPAVQQGG